MHVGRLLKDFCSGPGARAAWFEEVAADGPPIAAHANRPMPAASLVKLFVVEALLVQVGAESVDEDAVAVATLGATIYPSVLAAKSPDDQLSWRELCALTLITSDNRTASFALEIVGLDAVNAQVASLGLSHTSVQCSFEDEYLGAAARANISTARDMGTALMHVWSQRAEFPYRLISHWLLNNLRNDRLPARLPEDVGVMHKTGSLEGVVNDAGIVSAERPYALAVLMDEQEDRATAAIEISKLSKSVYDTIAQS